MPGQLTAAADELIDALHGVTDLDRLHAHLINDATDKFSSPQFSTWLLELVNAERAAREAAEGFGDYPLYEFSTWPPAYLYQAVALTLAIAEAAIIQGEPTILQFCLRLQQLLVGSLGKAFLEAKCVIANLTPEV
jgi:hypothetical protein